LFSADGIFGGVVFISLLNLEIINGKRNGNVVTGLD
jgi:hypothetical protein